MRRHDELTCVTIQVLGMGAYTRLKGACSNMVQQDYIVIV